MSKPPDSPPVFGRDLDPQTRCAHWHSPLDIIAIKMKCCGAYWACRECHDEPHMITETAIVCPDVAGVEQLLEQQRIPFARTTLAFTPATSVASHDH